MPCTTLHMKRAQFHGKLRCCRQSNNRFRKQRLTSSIRILESKPSNWKGIKEFRDVEKRAVDEQERIRVAAKYKAVVSRTKQEDLFGPPNPDLQIKTYEDERKSQLKIGYERLLYIMSVNKKGIKYQEIIGFVLQTPLVWEGDLKAWLTDLRNGGRIIIPELTGRERVPKVGYTIVPILP